MSKLTFREFNDCVDASLNLSEEQLDEIFGTVKGFFGNMFKKPELAAKKQNPVDSRLSDKLDKKFKALSPREKEQLMKKLKEIDALKDKVWAKQAHRLRTQEYKLKNRAAETQLNPA